MAERGTERQSRWMSAIEAVANVAVGWGVSLILVMLVLPLFGYPVTSPDAVAVSVIFTGASLVRSYALRRVFSGVRADKSEAERRRGD